MPKFCDSIPLQKAGLGLCETKVNKWCVKVKFGGWPWAVDERIGTSSGGWKSICKTGGTGSVEVWLR